MMTKVSWGLGMLGTKRRFFGNIVGHAKGVSDASSLSSWTAEAFDQSLDWKRIGQLIDMWDGKVILKGILDADDAKKAAELGADAIVVSNHGGRQLDGASSSIRMLSRIVDAVGHETEVLFDSGIRSGQDVLKAIALGAKGTMIGRAYTYGLGANGEQGVTDALKIIHKELDTTMGAVWSNPYPRYNRDILIIPDGFHRK